MLPAQTEVLIVGAGPAGLTLGATLASAGIDSLVIDKAAHGQTTSRAAAVHARTLEVLEPLDVAARMVGAGLKMPSFVARDRDRELMTVGFADLPTRYPYVLTLPQSDTESILAARLAELGGTLHRSIEAVDLRLRQERAEADLRVSDGTLRTVRARYVVGADGYHSLVRERAGIRLAAGTYAESFVLGDVAMDWPFGRDAIQLFLSRDGLLVVVPMPHDRYRVIATMETAPEHPTRDDLQGIVDSRGPERNAAFVRHVHWSSRFRIHHGIAAAFRSQNAFLVGDAAHVHSPAGGQGMNIGIQDARRLGEALVSVLRDGAGETALDAYEAERRPVAEHIVRQTDRLTRLATLRGGIRRELRNILIDLAGHLPAVRHTFAMELSELHR